MLTHPQFVAEEGCQGLTHLSEDVTDRILLDLQEQIHRSPVLLPIHEMRESDLQTFEVLDVPAMLPASLGSAPLLFRDPDAVTHDQPRLVQTRIPEFVAALDGISPELDQVTLTLPFSLLCPSSPPHPTVRRRNGSFFLPFLLLLRCFRLGGEEDTLSDLTVEMTQSRREKPCPEDGCREECRFRRLLPSVSVCRPLRLWTGRGRRMEDSSPHSLPREDPHDVFVFLTASIIIINPLIGFVIPDSSHESISR